MFAAVIFDFDGLIVDTETPAFEAWSEIYARYACELALEQWRRCVGADYQSGFDPVANLASLLRARSDPRAECLDAAALLAEKDQRKKAICQQLGVLAGVGERLAEARALGWRTALASGSTRAWVCGHLQRLGLEASFDVVRTRDDVARIKPFPDVYLAAATALSLSPAACLAFEDSLNGVKAAKAAGMHCVAVPNGITRGMDLSAADLVANSLADLSLASLSEGRHWQR